MKALYSALLVIPCLSQGILAQRPSASAVASADTTMRPLTAASDTGLRPIGLQEAIQLAQRNAPAAVQARGQIRTSNSAVRSAYGALLPSVSLSAGQTNQSGDRMDAQGRIVPYAGQQPWSYNTGLNANVRVFDGGRNWSEINRSKADVNAAEASEIAQRYNVVSLQVKTQYYAILAARESESAAQSQLDLAQQQLRAASAKVQAGAATLSDSLRSIIQVGNARLALLTARNNLRAASAALTRLVATPFLVTAQPSDTLDLPIAPLDSTSLTQLAENGPAVEQARAQLTSSQASVRSARAPYLPNIDLTFSKGGNGYDKFYGLGDPFAYTQSFGIRMSYPLFNNFQREDALTRARVQEENADAALRDARLAAQQNIIQQLGTLRTAEERIQIQQASVAAAAEDLRVQQQRYTLGASTLLDLLTSQSTLTQARAQLIQARQDYRLARAQIEATIGRDLR
jgi:outer membrane protein